MLSVGAGADEDEDEDADEDADADEDDGGAAAVFCFVLSGRALESRTGSGTSIIPSAYSASSMLCKHRSKRRDVSIAKCQRRLKSAICNRGSWQSHNKPIRLQRIRQQYIVPCP